MDLLCGEGEDKEICHELPINTSETPCFLLHHERPCPALPPSTLWNLTNHISTKNHGSFGSLHPQSLQDIDEAILLYLVAFKIYRHTWARSDRKNNLILAATTEKSNYYLGRSVSPSFKTK